MQIRLGYELNYNFPEPTPVILALSIHYSRAADIIITMGCGDACPVYCYSSSA